MPVDWSTYAIADYDIWVEVFDTVNATLSGPYPISVLEYNNTPVINFIYDDILGSPNYKNPVDQNDPPVTYSVDYTDPDTGQTHTFTWWIVEDGETPDSGDLVTMPVDWSGYSMGPYDIHVEVDDGQDSTSGSFDIWYIDASSDIIFVDDSNTSGVEDGSPANPFNTINEGTSAASAGYKVWVDDSGGVYTEMVNMKSDVDVLSTNWDTSDGSNRAAIDAPQTEDHSVFFNTVNNALLEGFEIHFAGPKVFMFTETWAVMVYVEGGSGNTVRDCYFSDNTNYEMGCGIRAQTTLDCTVEYCKFADLDRGSTTDAAATVYGVYSYMSDGTIVRNSVFTEFRSTYGAASAIEIGACYFYYSDNAIAINNLVHDFAPDTDSGFHALYGFRFRFSDAGQIVNNTIDALDATGGSSMFTAAVSAYLQSSTISTFTNHIASNFDGAGVPPGSSYVWAVWNALGTVTCDYTDTWDIYENHYYNPAGIEGTGCILADPQYTADYDVGSGSGCQNGDPSITDWDDTGSGGSRMGCHGGPDGETVGLLTPL